MITFVNSTAGTRGTAASTWSMATHSSRAGGAAFIVGIGVASSVVSVSAVTDNTTNVYQLAIANNISPVPAAGAELWYVNQISSASTRISVTLSGSASGSMGIAQFTGLSTGSPHDSTQSTAAVTTANSTVHTAGQVTPGEANSLVIMFSRAINSTIVPTALDGGQSAWISTGQAVRTIGGYIIQGAASTAQGRWRTNAAGTTGGTQHASAIATFLDTRAAGGGGGGVLWAGFMPLMGVQ